MQEANETSQFLVDSKTMVTAIEASIGRLAIAIERHIGAASLTGKMQILAFENPMDKISRDTGNWHHLELASEYQIVYQSGRDRIDEARRYFDATRNEFLADLPHRTNGNDPSVSTASSVNNLRSTISRQAEIINRHAERLADQDDKTISLQADAQSIVTRSMAQILQENKDFQKQIDVLSEKVSKLIEFSKVVVRAVGRPNVQYEESEDVTGVNMEKSREQE